MDITITGDDRYHVFQDDLFTNIEEDVNGSQLMGMTSLTTQEMFELSLKPIGYKITIHRE